MKTSTLSYLNFSFKDLFNSICIFSLFIILMTFSTIQTSYADLGENQCAINATSTVDFQQCLAKDVPLANKKLDSLIKAMTTALPKPKQPEFIKLQAQWHNLMEDTCSVYQASFCCSDRDSNGQKTCDTLCTGYPTAGSSCELQMISSRIKELSFWQSTLN